MEQPDATVASRPRSADIAFGLALTAAACAIVFGALVPFQIASTVDHERQAAAAKQLSAASLQQTLTIIAIAAVAIAVIYAAVLALLAVRFRQGRRRARIGFVVLAVLALAPLNVPALLVCALVVAATLLAYRRPVSEWLRSSELVRARR